VIDFVAEVSSNHNHDLSRSLAFIDAAAAIGCTAVKFQLFRIRELFAPEIMERSAKHRRREAWELPTVFLPELVARCRQKGVKFGCTPFYLQAVEELKPHVDFYKIASYEILWNQLLEACAATGKPVVLSTGMAVIEEVRAAVETLKNAGCHDLTLLHCISGYPTPLQECNLAAIETLRNATGMPVGWSDHSTDPSVISRAVHRWGACMVEFHLDLDGTGDEFSMGHCWLPHRMAPVIAAVHAGWSADGTGEKLPAPSEVPDRDWRADPQDGLRPLQATRKTFQGDADGCSQTAPPPTPAVEAMIRTLPEVDLNEYLSRDNVWTMRLMGLENFHRERNADLIRREYNEDFYGRLLETYRSDPQALRRSVIEPAATPMKISLGDRIFTAPLHVYFAIARHHMWSTLKLADHPFLCELGAGYGTNLLWYQAYGGAAQIYAGEYAENAVIMGCLLGLDLHRFDFYDPETYRFIKADTQLFTSHAIEQLPDARVFLDALKGIRERIRRVVHFEPVYRNDRRNLIGLLRNRYAEINHYNTNLLECLQNDREIEILSFQPDVHGINPLNPASVIVWEFR
jgi:sialic acid synthase SpsE